ncbi:hypothetical protein KK062_28900 [Fulvivirgaceae bacterium PWU5]|uniref:Uncharacterized protein n=1 Tax=Dawidia cretensis TaxID=2782350 RepID=A0AAP2E3B7_9BACT|nr:hypothetical protein [Dawidia cretensis]MBT1712296.1 hypothetical protein [Dawidia cretensis]
MNSIIRSHDDLLAEQERLRLQLKVQKEQIRDDLSEIKEEFKPVLSLVRVIGKFTSRETRNDAIVTTGSSLAIDLLLKKFVSNNLLARMFLPSLLKNVSSHVIFNNVAPFLGKLFKKKGRSNGLAVME